MNKRTVFLGELPFRAWLSFEEAANYCRQGLWDFEQRCPFRPYEFNGRQYWRTSDLDEWIDDLVAARPTRTTKPIEPLPLSLAERIRIGNAAKRGEANQPGAPPKRAKRKPRVRKD